MPHEQGWLDRTLGAIAPRWQLQRVRAKLATQLVLRHYEAASAGRRTTGWNRFSGDANATNDGTTLARLRDVSRDLVRNNPYAAAALNQIVNDTIGWGIVAKSTHVRAMDRWKAWAETTACDADGRHDIYGLQKMVMRAVVESGEVLIRRRMRRLEDGFPLPLQLQVIEPDLLDTAKTETLPNGGSIVQGIEFDPLGARAGYWLLPIHPGATSRIGGVVNVFAPSYKIPASEILHVFVGQRPGQVRAPSWFANVLLRFKDFDEYEDATLMKQKIAACLAVITSDVDGSASSLGTADDTETPGMDMLEPGAIINAPPGRTIEVVQPPAVRDHESYTAVTLRGIAAGLGVLYEGMTGDHTQLSFSAARMSRLSHQPRVDDWRWRLLIPQFCDPVWGWAMEAAQILGVVDARPAVRWSPPPMPMINPSEEGLAYSRNIRNLLITQSEAIRERGYDPDEVMAEMAADNAKLDKLGLVLDSDARRMTQAGQGQSVTPAASAPEATGGTSGAPKDGTAAEAAPDGTTPKDAQTIFGYHLQYGVAKLGDARKNLNLPPDKKTDDMTVPEYLKWLAEQPAGGNGAHP